MGVGAAHGADPWADTILSYDSGTTPAPGGYTLPASALGEPSRLTGASSPYDPSVVSPFNPPFWFDEVVSVGEGGHLTVRFDEPISNAPTNRFGIDFLIFGNGGFEDVDFPNGRTSGGPTPSGFGFDATMRVAVSEDGTLWYEYPGNFTEGLFPTSAYLDGGPFDALPGSTPSDYTRPVDPSLTPGDFSDRTLAQIRTLYDGSGGGTGVDLAASGFDKIQFVRISVLDDGNPDTAQNVEIDAFSTVPEPSTLMCVALGLCGVLSRRR